MFVQWHPEPSDNPGYTCKSRYVHGCLLGHVHTRLPACWQMPEKTGSGADDSVLGNIVVEKVDRGSMTPGAICSINDLPDVYTVLKACKHTLMASCKSRQ